MKAFFAIVKERSRIPSGLNFRLLSKILHRILYPKISTTSPVHPKYISLNYTVRLASCCNSPFAIYFTLPKLINKQHYFINQKKLLSIYSVLVGKPGRHRHRWEDNIKMDLLEIGLREREMD
jgi:hypothetical protein